MHSNLIKIFNLSVRQQHNVCLRCRTTLCPSLGLYKIQRPNYINVHPIVLQSLSRNHRPKSIVKRSYCTSDEEFKAQLVCKKLYSGERASLAQCITLVESVHHKKKQNAKQLLCSVMERANPVTQGAGKISFRIGLSGSPGSGKSTLINVLGKHLIAQGHKVAVLAVDPSSSRTGGSILGDKTRMPELCVDQNAFIRPSPSSGTLGGVTRTTSEAILLCEAAGYDVILVETVGVGQSEYVVSEMVDLFLLLVNPGGGDELQGVKRGIMEMADIVAVTKADGDLAIAARKTQSEYLSAFKIIRSRSKLWRPVVLRVSAAREECIEELCEKAKEFQQIMLESGEYIESRRKQSVKRLWRHIEHDFMMMLRSNEHVRKFIPEIEEQVLSGKLHPGMAADMIIELFTKRSS